VIFQSTIPGKTYTVVAGIIERDNLGRLLAEHKGLRAKFRGPQRIFDSQMAQGEHGWSDEDRAKVEAFLIGHADFHSTAQPTGPGAQSRIYLAHGQGVPPEHAEVYTAAMARLESFGQLTAPVGTEFDLPAPPARCMAFSETVEGLVRCSKLAEQGSDLCEEEHVSSERVSV